MATFKITFAEQICGQAKPGVRKYMKRKLNKSLRKAAKLDIENAPTKRIYCGWTD